jgi:hypothetical protein
MQRDQCVLEERPDSSRKGAIDLYGTHTNTFWRMYGWRMPLYSLACARRTHVRPCATTCWFIRAVLGATLATRGRMLPSWLVFFRCAPFPCHKAGSRRAWRCLVRGLVRAGRRALASLAGVLPMHRGTPGRCTSHHARAWAPACRSDTMPDHGASVCENNE